MIVPSRSIKMADDRASGIFAVLSKTGDEFISRHSRRSKFAHDYCASMVGNLSRFNWSRAADQPKREERNRGVARTRDIENLTSLRADVVRRFVLPEKHHSVFTQRNQDILSFPFLKKRFTGVLKIGVFCRRFLGVPPGNPRCKKCFSAVWFDNCNTAPVDIVSRIGIGCHYLTSRSRLPSNLVYQFGCHKALAVILKNNCIGFFKTVSNRRDCHRCVCALWGKDFFAIDTNHLLIQRDDTGFNDRAKTFVLDRAGRVDVLLGQELPELAATAVFTKHSDYSHVIDEFAQVPGNVGRASRVERFSSHLHYWDRRLR